MMLWQEKAEARYMYYVLSLAWLIELIPPLPPSLSLKSKPKPTARKPSPSLLSLHQSPDHAYTVVQTMHTLQSRPCIDCSPDHA